MQKFLNTLWEFTSGKEDKDNFTQNAFKVCKVFKVKPLKTPRPDVPSKKTAYNLFCKDIRKIKTELQGVPVYKASAVISKEWKKVKASDKKMKKYRDLYEVEKGRHEEALQRYQEDNMDGMEIINLHKRCNKKARKTPRPKKAPKSPKSDDSSEEEQKPKKASKSSEGKKVATKAGKKVKKIPQPRKAPKSTEFIDSSEEEDEGPPKDDKGEKIPPLLGMNKEVRSFFYLRKDSKILTVKKKVERVVFMGGPMKATNYHMLHYMIPNTSKRC